MPVLSPTERLPNNTLVGVPAARRLNNPGWQPVTANRCPGGSVQPAPDGSSPRPFAGCDTSTTPPGP
jgi:hypothetical protein